MVTFENLQKDLGDFWVRVIFENCQKYSCQLWNLRKSLPNGQSLAIFGVGSWLTKINERYPLSKPVRIQWFFLYHDYVIRLVMIVQKQFTVIALCHVHYTGMDLLILFLVQELQKMFNDSDSFFYSPTGDLTNTLQRQFSGKYNTADPLWTRVRNWILYTIYVLYSYMHKIQSTVAYLQVVKHVCTVVQSCTCTIHSRLQHWWPIFRL